MDSLLCKKCETKFNNAHELFDHAASHHNWMRYACKLCNFKHYCFENLPEHVKVVHKLKGDKDFVYSTVKAINGPEALEMCRIEEDSNISNDTSPDSRRPSRCSSDSSRLSDDSSSSSTRVEIGTRKRKLHHSKIQRRREPTIIGKRVLRILIETSIHPIIHIFNNFNMLQIMTKQKRKNQTLEKMFLLVK